MIGRAATVLTALAVLNFLTLGALHRFWFEPLNGGEKLFDGRFSGYSHSTAQAIVENLGEDGRAAHIFWHNGILDTTFPLILSLAAIFVLASFGSRLSRFSRLSVWWRYAMILCFVLPYTAADLVENAFVRLILENGLPVDPALVAKASALTVTKWAFVAIAFAVIIVFWIVARIETGRDSRA